MAAAPYTAAELAGLRAAAEHTDPGGMTRRLLATIAVFERDLRAAQANGASLIEAVRVLATERDEARAERDAVCVRFDELRATVREVLRKDHGRCDDCNNFARLSTKTGQLYCYPCAELDYEDDEIASLALTPYETALRRLRELSKEGA